MLCPRKMVWQEAAQLPGIYKMGSRFAGLRPVSIVTHMIFLCVAFHAAFAA
uniref:YubP n=1 Tax=Escherichia coli TaxID=562 RepID=D9Z573_ECOLX|nr:YubP [Escherichia coli]ADL14148.1 YubP [Escherichia coli]